jgi:stage V sporulation protein AE
VLARGVREAVHTDGLLGVLTGGLSATAAGVAAAMVLGLLAALLFKSRPKRA